MRSIYDASVMYVHVRPAYEFRRGFCTLVLFFPCISLSIVISPSATCHKFPIFSPFPSYTTVFLPHFSHPHTLPTLTSSPPSHPPHPHTIPTLTPSHPPTPLPIPHLPGLTTNLENRWSVGGHLRDPRNPTRNVCT